MTNRFDKPYNNPIKINDNKIGNLFNIANNMDCFELKNFALMNKIPLSIQDKEGNNIIHKTILNDNGTEVQKMHFIKFLIEENVNPDAPNSENITPLHLACQKQYETIIKYLLEIGVDINYLDNFNNNAYHYTFSSELNIHKQYKQKSIIKPKKQINNEKKELIKNHKLILFNQIKESPFMSSIINSIKNTISKDEYAKDIVINFNKDIIQQKLNIQSQEKEKIIKEIYGVSLNAFIEKIKSEWDNFPKLNEIEIHATTDNSYPNEDDLSIIKNSDYKKYIKNEIETMIDKIIQDCKTNDEKNLIDLQEIHDKLYLDWENSGFKYDKYENYINTFIHPLAIDTADDIIELNNLTIMGGSRIIYIIDPINKDNFIETLLKKSEEYLIRTLLLSLFFSYDIAEKYNNSNTTLNFIFQNNNFVKNITINTLINCFKYLTKLALNEDVNEIEKKIIEDPNSIPKYVNQFKQLFKKRETSNIGRYIYIFGLTLYQICFSVNIYHIRQGFIYLCSAIIYNNGDIKKSFQNIIKSCMIDNIITNNNITNNNITNNNLINTFNNWIFTLLTLYNEQINDKLESIIELSTNFFNNDNNINYDNLKWINKKIKNLSQCQILGLSIIKYYQEMEHKPLLQNVIDTINLIRFFEINKTRKPQLSNDDFISKLKTLYFPPTDRQVIDIYNNANFDIANLNEKTSNEYYNKLFQNTEDIKLFEQITEYQISSRINYYILKYNNITNYTHLLKQIEAGHFGLNYIGSLYNFYNNDHKYLFNYYNLQISQNAFIKDNFYFHNTNNIENYRPPLIFSYISVLFNMKNIINKMENKILPKIQSIMERLKNHNKELYTKAIGYYYPILNALESHEKFFTNLLNQEQNNEKFNLPNLQQLKQYFNNDNNFNINIFTQHINRLNGLFYLSYYLSSNTENINIPKFLYHQLGNNPITIFDDNNNINTQQNNITDITNIDKRRGTFGYISDLDYNNVLKNITHDRFFISKSILNEQFITSKDKKLPPSFKVMYNDFYKYNIIEIIKTILDTNIDDKIYKYFDIFDYDKTITKQYLNAIMTEQIIKDYLINRIYSIGYIFLNQILQIKIDTNITLESFSTDIFGPIDYNINLNEDINNEVLEYINTNNNTYNFYTNAFNKFATSIKEKENFILYPCNYNNNLFSSFFSYTVKKNILELLLNNGCNIFNINKESQLPLLNILKHYNYIVLDEYKSLGIDYNEFENDNYLSPLKFINNEYNNHIHKFTFKKELYREQIDSFVNPQYNEIEIMFKSNEKLGYNILNNLKLSFTICNYITQHYLAEQQYIYSGQDIINISKLLNINILDFTNLFINNEQSFLPLSNLYITISDMHNKLSNKLKILNIEIRKLKKDVKQFTTNSIFKVNIENKIHKIKQNITKINIKIKLLKKTKNLKFSQITLTKITPNIIERYNILLNRLNKQTLVYMDNWNKELDNLKNNKCNENIFQKLLNDDNNININISNNFFSNCSLISEEYFQNKYSIHLLFVRDLLIHLTKIVICTGIETMISKILLDKYIKNEINDIIKIEHRIKFIFIKFRKYLYDELSIKLVINSTNIFTSDEEENEHIPQSIYDILNDSITYLTSTSPINIDDYTINNIKEGYIYFDNIIKKIINNWRITIENVFLYSINHNRIQKCKIILSN